MADVFISYSQKSAEPAKALAETLKAKGIEVWWDVRLVAGQRFDDVVRDDLLKADAAIVIWTTDSVQSDYVRMEAGIAWAFDKLIPCASPACRPPASPRRFAACIPMM